MVDYGSLPGTPVTMIPAIPSEIQTTSKVIFAQPCMITCVKLFTNGTNDVTIEIFDDATGEVGNVKDKWYCVGADKWGGGALPFPLYLNNGAYFKITGSGGSYVAHYVDLKRG
jgi:hypothetical protein